jgi:hypothetical protein
MGGAALTHTRETPVKLAVDALVTWAAAAPTPDPRAAHGVLCSIDPVWEDPAVAWQLAPNLVVEARRRKTDIEEGGGAGIASRSRQTSAADVYFIAIRLYADFRRAALRSAASG